MIDAMKLREVGIDYDAGLQRFLNDTALYEAVLHAFLSENIIEQAEIAFSQADENAMMQVAHSIKGASGSAGFQSLYEVSSALVLLLREKNFTQAQLDDAYQKFITEYQRVWNGVRSALR